MRDGIELILKYYPELSEQQKKLYILMYDIYMEWNQKINVISRKDIANLYENHVLHSLGIAKFIKFKPHTRVLDLGTGGGFPGIPLAIYFPDVNFHLVDSVKKKIYVVNEVVKCLKLNNVTFENIRVENCQKKFHFIISRAVAPLKDLVNWTKGKFLKENFNEIPNGIICLKGGNLEHELQPFKNIVTDLDLSGYFDEELFKDKKVVYLPANN